MGTPCFVIEQSGRLRYTAEVECVNGHRELLLTREGQRPAGGAGDHDAEWQGIQISRDEVKWPERCSACAVEIDYDDHPTIIGGKREWIRRDTGETHWNLRDFGPGAIWNADWMPSAWKRGCDGQYLMCMLPNGWEWAIDSEASNCTRPGEDHDCWCRHGEPPNLTVDKVPEPGRSTCAAGAGSIQGGDWHGFLRDGVLVVA